VALLLLALPGAAGGEELDPRVAWLRQHALAVRSLDPAATDFQDLVGLSRVLAGVRVVLLGEATHGDGTTFRAKTRLIHYLHQELGFDVLILDCGLYDGERARRQIAAGGDARAAMRQAVPAVYADAEQFQPLLDLVASLARSERPLAVAGFDDEVTGWADAAHLAEDLGSQLGRLGVRPDEIPGLGAALEILTHLARDDYDGGEPLPPRGVRRDFARTLAALAARLAPAAAGDPEAALWLQLVRGFGPVAETTWKLVRWNPAERFARGAPHVPPEIQNVRYRQLADNLLWLLRERYGGSKVIVWSTTIFLTRDLDRLTTGEADTRERFDRFKVPGDFLSEALGEQAYLLAFTSFDGRKGRALPGREPSPLLVPTRGSFEGLMGETGLAAAIVDLRGEPAGGEWLRRALIARPISDKELLGIWRRHVDGLFFVRTMEPAQRRDR
jgi:erythromycin esterase-like protein